MRHMRLRRYMLLVSMLLVVLTACEATPTPVIPDVAQLPSPTITDTPVVPTPTLTPTSTNTPTITLTPSATWTPIVIVATYTPSITFTPSITYTPSNTPTFTATYTPTRPPTFTPTMDQPAPVVMAVAPDVGGLVTPIDPRCAPITTNITANIDSSVGLYTINLNYTFNGQGGQVIPMTNQGEGLYTAPLGPFNEPGVISYWLTMSDNWGKWQNTDPQQITVSECDVDAINATAIAAATNAATATALAQFGGGSTNPAAFQAANLDLTTPYQTPLTITFSALNGTPPYTFLINSLPANGTLAVLDNFTAQYTPDPGYIGSDTFTYLATDVNGMSDVGVISIDVTAPTPLTGTLTFASDADSPGITDIFIMNANGTGLDNLTRTNTENDRQPSWSPAGDRIVFVSDSDGDDELYVIDVSSRTITKLTDNGWNDYQPAWSPDGARIAYISNQDGDPEIFTMPAGGGAATQVTVNTREDFNPAWSPNSGQLVYQAGSIGAYDIYVRDWNDSTGATEMQLTSGSGSNIEPVWSPNGNLIAFASNRDGGFEIYTMATDGTSQARKTNNDPAIADRGPAWSADSTQIVFYQDNGSVRNVYWLDINSPSPQPVVGGRDPDWHP